MSKKLRLGFFYHPSCVRLPFNPNELWSSNRGLTGSELAFFMYAIELAKFGHGVTVFSKFTHPSNIDNVVCCPYQEWENVYKDQSWNALCSWMVPTPLKFAKDGVFRFYNQQVSDFNMCEPGWEQYIDIVAPLSFSHAEHMIGKCSVPKEKWRILYNGVDTSLFKPSNKIRGKMIWASSHDRGLHWLLEAFPKIKKESPHANLHIFYDFNGVNVFSKWENLDKNTQSGRYGNELGQRSRYVLEAIRRLKNYDVFVHESVSRKRIIEEMSTSEVLAYPLDPIHYTETFGVTVLEACASGVVPVLCTSDAFGELWGNVSETVLPPYTEHKEEFIDKTVKLLNDDEYRANMSIKCVRESQKFDWSVLSKNLNECIESNGVSGLPIIC